MRVCHRHDCFYLEDDDRLTHLLIASTLIPLALHKESLYPDVVTVTVFAASSQAVVL